MSKDEDFGSNGIMNVHKPSRGWGIVDRNMMADKRISIEARGVLGWLATRHDEHRLFVSHLKRECLLGQSKWQRIRHELEGAGYFKSTRKVINRRFAWEFDVYLSFDGMYQNQLVLNTSKTNAFKTSGYIDTEGSDTEVSDTNHHTPQSKPASAPQALPLGVCASPAPGRKGRGVGLSPAPQATSKKSGNRKQQKATQDRFKRDLSPPNSSSEVSV
jgi:hypothetical protein